MQGEDLHIWHTKGVQLKEEMIVYNWAYRRKICTKCTIENQSKLQCHKVNNFVNGIQETHCKKLIRSRTKKFKNKINEFLEIHPSCNSN